MRQAAVTKSTRLPPEHAEPADTPDESDDRAEAARRTRLKHQTQWVELQVRQAMDRGDFDRLPGAGRPLRGLDGGHDPNWWVKRLVEREQIGDAVLPPALALRTEANELLDRIDRETTELGVRRLVSDFNQRVVEARRQLLGGPPVITRTRDVELEVRGWRDRRAERLRRQRELLAATTPPVEPRRRWWKRLLPKGQA
jgi:DnaJ homologue, subfamily C, member 28, conserved domain